MLKLLRKLRKREVIMFAICEAFILGQVYFDLRLPDYMTDLTRLIQTPGSEVSAIWATGLEMLKISIPSLITRTTNDITQTKRWSRSARHAAFIVLYGRFRRASTQSSARVRQYLPARNSFLRLQERCCKMPHAHLR